MLFLAALPFGFAAMETNAQGTRDRVVLEVFTGTWCTFCPGSALGTDDLISNGKSVAPVKYHIGDSYEYTESTARDGYYAVGGYPTSWFDGKYDIVGGNASQSIYPAYLIEYNTAMAAATPFNLTMTTSLTGNNLTVNYTASQVGAYSAGNLVAHVVVTESHIPENWLAGLTEVNYVVRDMAPTDAGTAFTVMMGGSYSGTEVIALNPAWVQADMEVVVFIQNSQTKEIFNSVLSPLLPSQYSIEPSLSAINNEFPAASCATSVTPEVTIYNGGNTAITSLDINYNLNGTTGTFNWTGNLPYYYSAVVTLPAINFTPQASNSLAINISNPNSGAVDQLTTNNAATATWNGANQHATGQYTLTLQLDRYGSETTWEFLDGTGGVIASGGPYQDTQSGQPLPTPITANATYNANDCVSFNIMDAFGDGICCGYGAGSYTVTDPFGNTVATGGQFTSEEATEWETDLALANARDLSAAVAVFPNPSNGNFTVALGNDITGEATLSMMTLEGKVLFSTIVSGNEYQANVSELPAGIYLLKVRTENGQAVKKLTIK